MLQLFKMNLGRLPKKMKMQCFALIVSSCLDSVASGSFAMSGGNSEGCVSMSAGPYDGDRAECFVHASCQNGIFAPLIDFYVSMVSIRGVSSSLAWYLICQW